jgi:hypothetical protein
VNNESVIYYLDPSFLLSNTTETLSCIALWVLGGPHSDSTAIPVSLGRYLDLTAMALYINDHSLLLLGQLRQKAQKPIPENGRN